MLLNNRNSYALKSDCGLPCPFCNPRQHLPKVDQTSLDDHPAAYAKQRPQPGSHFQDDHGLFVCCSSKHIRQRTAVSYREYSKIRLQFVGDACHEKTSLTGCYGARLKALKRNSSKGKIRSPCGGCGSTESGKRFSFYRFLFTISQVVANRIIKNPNYRVEKMLFADKTINDYISYNGDIHIENILAEAYEYVGNGRSAVEWIMECYRIKTDKASGITNVPND